MSWSVIRASAFDHPNLTEDCEVIPGGPSREWVEDVRREYGEDSPYYVARVLARFPETSIDSLVENAWLERAVEAHRERRFTEDEYRHTLGLDVARFGRDASVACIRRGHHVFGFREWRGLDTQELERAAYALAVELHDAGRSPVRRIVVDGVGIGAGVVDKLGERLPGDLTWWAASRRRGPRERSTKLTDFVGGAKAADPDMFTNAKAEAYWHVRKLLEEGRLALPDDEQLMDELRATRIEFTADGRTALVSKDEIKRDLGGASPDRADALAMSFAAEARAAARFRKGAPVRVSPPIRARIGGTGGGRVGTLPLTGPSQERTGETPRGPRGRPRKRPSGRPTFTTTTTTTTDAQEA